MRKHLSKFNAFIGKHSKIFNFIAYVLTLISVIISLWAFWAAQEQNYSLSLINQQLSTKTITGFPENLDYVNENIFGFIRKNKSTIDSCTLYICTDFPAYGSISRNDLWSKYHNNIQEMIINADFHANVDLITYDIASIRRQTKKQFSNQYCNDSIRLHESIERWCKYIDSPRNDISKLKEIKNYKDLEVFCVDFSITCINELDKLDSLYNNFEYSKINSVIPTFMWLLSVNNELVRGVISFPTYFNTVSESSFYTEDKNLLLIFLETFNTYKHQMHSLEDTTSFNK